MRHPYLYHSLSHNAVLAACAHGGLIAGLCPLAVGLMQLGISTMKLSALCPAAQGRWTNESISK